MARQKKGSLGERVLQKQRLSRGQGPSSSAVITMGESAEAPPEPVDSMRPEPPESAPPVSQPSLPPASQLSLRPVWKPSPAPESERARDVAPPSEQEEPWPVGVPRPRVVTRRWVAALAVSAGALGVVLTLAFARPRRPAVMPAKAASLPARTAEATPTPPAQSADPAPPAPTSSPTLSAAAPLPSAAPAPEPIHAKPADDKSTSATALRDHALALLQEAKNPEAMAAARAALDADPTDAMPYLVLGSALQDMGQWREAHRTYELCVKAATKGMLDECRAMLRRK